MLGVSQLREACRSVQGDRDRHWAYKVRVITEGKPGLFLLKLALPAATWWPLATRGAMWITAVALPTMPPGVWTAKAPFISAVVRLSLLKLQVLDTRYCKSGTYMASIIPAWQKLLLDWLINTFTDLQKWFRHKKQFTYHSVIKVQYWGKCEKAFIEKFLANEKHNNVSFY